MVRETNTQVKEINGHVRRHQEEIFGKDNQPGLKLEVDEIHDFMIGTKSSVKTIITLTSIIGAIGMTNLIAFILFVSNTLEKQ